jgi:heat shock protein 5
VLADANLSRSRIDEILLVGGSTRIPRIQDLVKKFFDGKVPSKGINPDEAVAYGAAVQAAILSEEFGKRAVLWSVNPLSLGIAVIGNRMVTLIPRNTRVPVRRQHNFTTVKDNQRAILLKVYEGEDKMVMNNHLLGQFWLDGIQIAPRGDPDIEVTFELDANGILSVHAIDIHTHVEKGIKIEGTKCMTDQQITAAIAQAAAHGNTGDTQNECEILASLVNGLTLKLENVGVFMTGEATAVHKSELGQTERWISQHPHAPREVCREKRIELQGKFASFLSSPRGFEDDNL